MAVALCIFIFTIRDPFVMTFTFKLDKKKHPIPEVKPRRDRQVYPWPSMKVGDSFFIETGDVPKIDKRVTASAWNYRRTKDQNFSIVMAPDTEKKDGILLHGLRVWRHS